MFGKIIETWHLRTTSIGNIKEEDKNYGIYNSVQESIFCKEYGFVKLHYTFENNIKIQFDLVNIDTCRVD